MSTTHAYASSSRSAAASTTQTRLRSLRALLGKIALYIVVAIFLLVTLLPIYWIVLSAFTPMTELFTTPLNYIPAHPSLINFETVSQIVPLDQQFINSVLL